MERWRLRWAFSVPSDLGLCWWVHRWAQTPPGWRSVCVWGSVCTLPQPIPELIPLGLSGPILGQEENRAWSNASRKTQNAGVAWPRLAAMLGPGLSRCALTPTVLFQHRNCSHQLPLPEGAGGEGWWRCSAESQVHEQCETTTGLEGKWGCWSCCSHGGNTALQHQHFLLLGCFRQLGQLPAPWTTWQHPLGKGGAKSAGMLLPTGTSGCSVLVMCPCFLLPAGPQHPALPHRHPGSERD